MLERDIDALTTRDTVSLDGLEADIWRRERHIAALRGAQRFMVSSQGAVLAVAVLVSAFTGVSVASRYAHPAFIIEEKMAPSQLLLGTSP